jgi:hypothetical protein
MYEYACHDGNYSMVGILAGARADEKAAEEAAKKSGKSMSNRLDNEIVTKLRLKPSSHGPERGREPSLLDRLR